MVVFSLFFFIYIGIVPREPHRHSHWVSAFFYAHSPLSSRFAISASHLATSFGLLTMAARSSHTPLSGYPEQMDTTCSYAVVYWNAHYALPLTVTREVLYVHSFFRSKCRKIFIITKVLVTFFQQLTAQSS